MTEWWTYRPDDFLLYSARTYYRLFEMTHAAVWPAQIVGGAAGVAIVTLALRVQSRSPNSQGLQWRRLAGLLLAAAWAWVAWAFHLERYSSIHWAAPAFAAAFFVQAALLLVWAMFDATGAESPPGRAAARLGLGLLAFAMLGYPLLAPLAGRPWLQAEAFALMPDPTALATLGWLLLSPTSADYRPWCRWLAAARWPIPLAWCTWSATMLAVMGSPEAWVLGGATGLVVVAGWRHRIRRS